MLQDGNLAARQWANICVRHGNGLRKSMAPTGTAAKSLPMFTIILSEGCNKFKHKNQIYTYHGLYEQVACTFIHELSQGRAVIYG
jgi:hypothetical protein